MRLELRGITKRFGMFIANDHISLTVEPGEIHCLLGENGAGKSTLMNVLYGLYQPEGGEILIDDVPQVFTGPGDAIRSGIGMVHQHFMLVPVFTVAENLMLGRETVRRGGFLDVEAARARVRDLSGRFGFELDPDARVEDLPVGVQQRVEIIKALSGDAQVLVFDEPTAVLTPQETDELMMIMRELKASGRSIVFITHKLREVRDVADRITVIRHGRVVGEADPGASTNELAAMMVGRDVELTVTKPAAILGPERLTVTNLTVADRVGRVTVDDVSFTVHAGEVLGVAGVQGNGQTELVDALLGLQPIVDGHISVDGEPLHGRDPRDVLRAGVGFIPEDRTRDGLVDQFSVAENLMLDRFRGRPFVRWGQINRRERDAFATDSVHKYDIRPQKISAEAGRLSGGNQQKVVVARELSRNLRVLIAAQPTRGVDVGSIEFIHRQIISCRTEGTAVLVVSTELDEVTALADRIMVMYRGKAVAIVPAFTPRAVLGAMMAGDSRPNGRAGVSAA